jgi:hypothetical protein
MCLKYILVRFAPPSSSLIPSLPFLWKISTAFILIFLYLGTKYIHHIHIPSFFIPIALPLVPPPGKVLFFPPALHFFLIKCMLIVQEGYSLVHQDCIYHAFIKLTPSPPLFTHPLSPYSPNIQHLTIQCIVLYSRMCGLFQKFSFSNLFFLSPNFCSPLREIH